jgi:hypothetical protein
MRPFSLLFLVLMGCAGGASDPLLVPSPTPAPTVNGDPQGTGGAVDPTAGTAIVGDGEIKGASQSGAGGDSRAGTPMMAPGVSSSSGGGGASAGASAGSSGSGGSSVGSGNGSVPAGILTAGAWDDNRNFDFFGKFRSEVAAINPPGLLPIGDGEYASARATVSALGAKSTLDVSLVIDTTGSMGDEIRYLQSEFDALARTIQARYPNAAQRWSLVLYKDYFDEYVVRWFDFRSDTVEFRTKLDTASAGGGGDFPESPDQALGIAHRLSWRPDPTNARVMFWVADAPHHADKAQPMADAIRATRDKGIHMYPVAASGIDDLTEHTMRTAAQLTGGRYLFLTDDSGVGGAHKEPRLPCYFVTKLNSAILRMVDVEMSGVYREPTQDEIIRTGGNPTNGICTLSGVTTTIY